MLLDPFSPDSLMSFILGVDAFILDAVGSLLGILL